MNTAKIASLLRQLADEIESQPTPAEEPKAPSRAPQEAQELKELQTPPEPLDLPWDEGEVKIVLKDLQNLGAKVLAAGGRAFLSALLSEFGVKALSAADPKDYAALARRIHEHLR